MACLLDTGFLYATLNRRERLYDETTRILSDIHDEVIFPVPALTEVAFLINRDLGNDAQARFLADLPDMHITLETPLRGDLLRTSQVLSKYSDQSLDFVDACIFAIAERLNVTRILTLDRRHLSIFRPDNCDAFELLPAL